MKFKSQNEMMKIITWEVLPAVNLADIKEGLQAVNFVDIEGKRHSYIDIIQDMDDGLVTSMKTVMTIEFLVRVGLHQGSALSPYLFALMMDSLITNIQCQDPWCMPLADDTILIN